MSSSNHAINSMPVTGQLMPYGLKESLPPVAVSYAGMAGMTQAAFEVQRAQLIDYNARLRYSLQCGLYGFSPYPFTAAAAAAAAGAPHAVSPDAVAYLYGKTDPRFLQHEEPKPSHSYIGLIAMAILSVDDNKLVLSDIYQWILDNYSYFRTRGPGWRNSIRHNLSLNDCFIKSGRSANGKGHFWAIHPANLDDFRKGDFRRRRAQRRVRKAMGLAVPDDEDSPSPPPSSVVPKPNWAAQVRAYEDVKVELAAVESTTAPKLSQMSLLQQDAGMGRIDGVPKRLKKKKKRRRLFDVESLLAPDEETSSEEEADDTNRRKIPSPKSQEKTCDIQDVTKTTQPKDVGISVRRGLPFAPAWRTHVSTFPTEIPENMMGLLPNTGFPLPGDVRKSIALPVAVSADGVVRRGDL